jgi:hypothetical protein
MNYRIVELHRQYSLECSKDGKQWLPVKATNVPQYFDSLEDARSWVATIKRGVVYHDAEYGRDKWFLDRVGKSIVQTRPYHKEPFMINNEAHARALSKYAHDMNFIYSDAPNLAQDERKAEQATWWSVTPNAEALDIGANSIVALFKHERQAKEWAGSMWGSFVLIEPHREPR